MEKARAREDIQCVAVHWVGGLSGSLWVGAALCARNPSLSSSFALFAFHTQLYFTFIILYFHIEGVVGAARLHAVLLLHHHLQYLHFILNYIILLSSYYVFILRERFHPPTCNCLFYLKPQVQGRGLFLECIFQFYCLRSKKGIS